jgi:hypothetical protein
MAFAQILTGEVGACRDKATINVMLRNLCKNPLDVSNTEAFASELVAGRISDIRGSATLVGTFVGEFAGELKLLDSQFIYMVLNENRKFAVEDEQRNYIVLPEDRTFDIDPESRGYQVLPENRTIEVGYFMQ